MDIICQGNNPQHDKTGEDTSLTIKHVLSERPLLYNGKRQFFGSTNKMMKQLINDGDIAYGDTLYKFVYQHSFTNKTLNFS